MEFENLAIVNTREGITEIIKKSKLPVMVVKLIMSEMLSILEKEADIVIKQEYDEYVAKQKAEEIKPEETEE